MLRLAADEAVDPVGCHGVASGPAAHALALAVGGVDLVVSWAAAEPIDPRSTGYRVGARAAGERVLARAAEQVVVAGPAAHLVVAGQAAEVVVPIAAVE